MFLVTILQESKFFIFLLIFAWALHVQQCSTNVLPVIWNVWQHRLCFIS